ncbi:hypothetical protein C2G38_2107478, partial [Gigaspora rosea]
ALNCKILLLAIQCPQYVKILLRTFTRHSSDMQHVIMVMAKGELVCMKIIVASIVNFYKKFCYKLT